jgi:hypothetical protein
MILVTRDTTTTPALNIAAAALRESSDRMPAQDPACQLQWDLSDAMALISMSADKSGVSLVQYHKDKLGRQDRCWNGEFRFWIWEREGYRVYISNHKGICFEVPQDATLEESTKALADYRWDLGCPKTMISRRENDALVQAGRDAVGGHSLEIERMPDDELRAFIHGYVSGTVFTDGMCEPGIAKLVFMPLALGALQPSEEVYELTKAPGLPQQPGPKPEKPVGPVPPEMIKYPKDPPGLTLVMPDPDRLRSLNMDIEWEDADPKDRVEYLAEIQAENDKRRAERDAAQAAHLTACAEADEANAANQAAHKADWEAHEKALGDYPERLREWQIADARRKAVSQGFFMEWAKNLGCVWENLSAAGPRSINGCPIFFSMRMMHREDWERARGAIEREHARRKNIDLDAQPSPSEG